MAIMTTNFQFNRPRKTPNEIHYIERVIHSGALVGGGNESAWCQEWLCENLGAGDAILTNSATDALELSAILIDLSPGDEVILPSYTFVSSANAFVLRGAVPVFVDINPDTFNMDHTLIEAAITPKTKAIVVVHYGGNPCEMNEIMGIARENNLYVIEDAAQGILSKFSESYLGTIGHLGILSFHGTKNIVSGEGGALLINDPLLIDRAHVISEKGTNRKKFTEGKVDKYTWVDLGSSFLASEVTAAYLHSQLENSDAITSHRVNTCFEIESRLQEHHDLLEKHKIKRFKGNSANGHMFPLVFRSYENRESFIGKMATKGFQCVSHYTALHSSEGGKKYGRVSSKMEVTDSVASGLVRLPIWSEFGLPVDSLVDSILSSIRE